MKKSFYLFNPGELSRKDNSLRFLPIEEGANGAEAFGVPRYIPVETVGDMYVFGSLRANSSLFNFHDIIAERARYNVFSCGRSQRPH